MPWLAESARGPRGGDLGGFCGGSTASRRPLAAPRTLLGSPAAGALPSGFSAKMGLGTGFLAPPTFSGIFWNFPPGLPGKPRFSCEWHVPCAQASPHLELGWACPGPVECVRMHLRVRPRVHLRGALPRSAHSFTECGAYLFNVCFSHYRDSLPRARISVFCVMLSLAPSEFLGT